MLDEPHKPLMKLQMRSEIHDYLHSLFRRRTTPKRTFELSVNIGWSSQASDGTTDAIGDTWLDPQASSDAERYPTELKVPSSWVKIQDELHKPLQPQSVTPDGTTHAIRDTSQASTDAEQHPTELLQNLMLWDSRTEIKDISGSSQLLQLAT